MIIFLIIFVFLILPVIIQIMAWGILVVIGIAIIAFISGIWRSSG